MTETHEAALMRRGAAKYNAKEFGAAIADYTEVITGNPKNAAAWFNRGSAYYGAGDQSRALADWEMAAIVAPGNAKYQETLKKAQAAANQKPEGAQAQYELGVTYDRGVDVDQDAKKAVYWYMRAAKQGHAQAQYNLGCCYYEGNGVDKDAGKAVYWYTQAAKQGLVQAQYNLGYCYNRGDGVRRNDMEANYWWTKAAEQGDADARSNLAYCYGNTEIKVKAERGKTVTDNGYAEFVEKELSGRRAMRIGVITVASVVLVLLGLFIIRIVLER
jgi:TPR repeat protein